MSETGPRLVSVDLDRMRERRERWEAATPGMDLRQLQALCYSGKELPYLVERGIVVLDGPLPGVSVRPTPSPDRKRRPERLPGLPEQRRPRLRELHLDRLEHGGPLPARWSEARVGMDLDELAALGMKEHDLRELVQWGVAVVRPALLGGRSRMSHPDTREPVRPRPKTTTRACLRCGRQFQSEGAHNRLCDRCQDANAKVSALAPDYGPAGSADD